MRVPLTVKAISGGVFVSTLTPFGDDGAVLLKSITDQARRLSRIEGVVGILVNTTPRERATLSVGERISVIESTRKGLCEDQILLCNVGNLSRDITNDAGVFLAAGANGIIAKPEEVDCTDKAGSKIERLLNFNALADKLGLPIIVALCHKTGLTGLGLSSIADMCNLSKKTLGVVMGSENNVATYDRDYYALKSLDRPLACFTSSSTTLFHNLNTGADGVLSGLAYIAPHEVAGLYRATRDGRIHEAQALHNRMAPLFELLETGDADTRELILREAAHYRGLLACVAARGIKSVLCDNIRVQLHDTLDRIALKPISWV